MVIQGIDPEAVTAAQLRTSDSYGIWASLGRGHSRSESAIFLNLESNQ